MIDEMREKHHYKVGELCEAFAVSRSGYYAAKSAPASKRSCEEVRIVGEMKAVHEDRHTRCYGSPRMTAELNARGIACTENRCARLMSKHGINARQSAAFRPKTTITDPEKQPAPNLLAEKAEPSVPGEIYVSDITYVATREGWLYLAVIIDLYSRSVVGWNLAEHMETRLVTAALEQATSTSPPLSSAVFHSDRGCQYTSLKMRKHLRLLGIDQSMSANSLLKNR